VYADRRCLCEEIIRNKFISNYNHSCFIHIVSFELELTSYIRLSPTDFRLFMQKPPPIFHWLYTAVERCRT
jgi:hypothetical protein